MTGGIYGKHLNDWVQLVNLTSRELIKTESFKMKDVTSLYLKMSVFKYMQQNVNANKNAFLPFNMYWLVPSFLFLFSEIQHHTEVSRKTCFRFSEDTVQSFRSQETLQTALLHISLDLNSVGIVYRSQVYFLRTCLN